MARPLTVVSLLFQSTTHCRYRVYTEFLLTYTAIYRRNRKFLPLYLYLYLSATFTWARVMHIAPFIKLQIPLGLACDSFCSVTYKVQELLVMSNRGCIARVVIF